MAYINNTIMFTISKVCVYSFPVQCLCVKSTKHYSDVIMSAMASQITGVSIVYSTVCSGADKKKYQSSASLVFVRGIHRSPVNSPHKGPVTRAYFHLITSSWVRESGHLKARTSACSKAPVETLTFWCCLLVVGEQRSLHIWHVFQKMMTFHKRLRYTFVISITWD